MIELKNVSYSYGRNSLPALDDVTVAVRPGIYLLAGENGAGKTTLLHLIAGVKHPDLGECLIDGVESSTNKPSKMGRTFLLEENMFFPGKTIRSFAKLHSGFYPDFSPQKFEDNLRAFGLNGFEPLKSLSLGNRKKSQLAYALALGVDVLLLDEPTNALDIQSKETLVKLLASNISEHQTLIVATHTVGELETLFDGALMITRSRLLFAGTAEALSEKISFKISRMPEPSSLYSEIQIGRVMGIYPRKQNEEPTNVDWRLFYSALHSPQRDALLGFLQSGF